MDHDRSSAFQADTGSLWTVGADSHGAWNLGMMADTSPAITALPSGGYEVAFQADTGSSGLLGLTATAPGTSA